jgi:amidase
MWLADGYDALVAAAEKEGDRGALVALAGQRDKVASIDLAGFSAVLTRRATLTRMWEMFFAEYPVLLLPVSAELPFPDQLDLQGDEAYARVWRAQMTQIGVPFMGLPGLSVAMGSAMSGAEASPVGVQVVAGRYREDLCLAAGEIIEAAGGPIGIAEPAAR